MIIISVYVNLLGTWTELTENDVIDGCSPQNFIENILVSENSCECLKITNDFVEVILYGKTTCYHIHKSQIQYTYNR